MELDLVEEYKGMSAIILDITTNLAATSARCYSICTTINEQQKKEKARNPDYKPSLDEEMAMATMKVKGEYCANMLTHLQDLITTMDVHVACNSVIRDIMHKLISEKQQEGQKIVESMGLVPNSERKAFIDKMLGGMGIDRGGKND